MKKILVIVAVVVVGFVGFKEFKHYNYTGKRSLAYAVVPEKIPEKKEVVDTDGEKAIQNDGKQIYSYVYTFEFEKRNGEKQTLEYRLLGTDVKPFKPGSRITAMISNTRVLSAPVVTRD